MVDYRSKKCSKHFICVTNKFISVRRASLSKLWISCGLFVTVQLYGQPFFVRASYSLHPWVQVSRYFIFYIRSSGSLVVGALASKSRRCMIESISGWMIRQDVLPDSILMRIWPHQLVASVQILNVTPAITYFHVKTKYDYVVSW